MLCRTIFNIWRHGSKSTALYWIGCPIDLRPIIMSGVKMLVLVLFGSRPTISFLINSLDQKWILQVDDKNLKLMTLLLMIAGRSISAHISDFVLTRNFLLCSLPCLQIWIYLFILCCFFNLLRENSCYSVVHY